MRRRYTNKSIGWRGDVEIVTARIPRPVAELMKESVGKPGLDTLSDVIQDACAVWGMIEEQAAEAPTPA